MTDKQDLIREIHEYVTTHGGENTATHLLVQAASAIQTQAAELDAVGAGGVQALSAAPAIGDELRDTLVAVSAAIAERDDRAAQKMICEILAASTTPPAEQQAQPGAVYAELYEPDATTVGLGAVWNRHSMRDFADRTHALRMQAAPKAAPVKACVCGEPQSSGTVHRVNGPCYVAAPKQEAQEPVAWQGVHDQTDLYYTKPLQADVRPLYTAPQPAPATQQAGDVVAYLDVGASGYLDLGAALSEDALQQLPKGRHALVIAGTYGIDGYVAAPQPSPTTKPAPQQEAQEPAPSAAVFGLRLVPVEPTDQMVQAAHHIDLSYMPGQEGADRAAIYRAMIAAAPQPAAQQWNDLIGKETHADADGLLVWRDEVDFAIPTPPAEQQAAPKAAPGDAIDEAMRERDDAEDFIDALLDEVLGHERPEWSSSYGRADALNDVKERMASLHKPAVDKAWGQFQSAMAAPQQEAQDATVAAFEAVRKKLCTLPRYSFVLDDDGLVRRAPDRTGNWIEFDEAHALFDPVSVDAAIAAQGGKA